MEFKNINKKIHSSVSKLISAQSGSDRYYQINTAQVGAWHFIRLYITREYPSLFQISFRHITLKEYYN
jgi:hypothetical protein